MNDLVSIIIPTYNRPYKLERAIESTLNQTYSNIETIIVDDNDPSSKFRSETEKIMAKYVSNERVKYIKHSMNMNGSVARNTGFKASSGDYIMYLDDDDEFLPNKVENQLIKLKSLDESWGACYTQFIRLKNGKLFDKSIETREGDLSFDLLSRNLFVQAGSNLMIRRKVVESVNGFDESFYRNQDLEFLLRIMKNYKLAYVPILGLKHHITQKKLSRTFDEITDHFLENFSTNISELNDNQYKKFNQLISLQRIRAYFKKREILKILKIMKSNKIGILIVVRYFFHLLIRRIRKQIGPFHI